MFTDKLNTKKQTQDQRERAAHAVSLYFELTRHPDSPHQNTDIKPANDLILPDESGVAKKSDAPHDGEPSGLSGPAQPLTQQVGESWFISEALPQYATLTARRAQYCEAGYEEKSDSPEWDSTLATLAAEIKVRHYSRKTLKPMLTGHGSFSVF